MQEALMAIGHVLFAIAAFMATGATFAVVLLLGLNWYIERTNRKVKKFITTAETILHKNLDELDAFENLLLDYLGYVNHDSRLSEEVRALRLKLIRVCRERTLQIKGIGNNEI